MLSSLVQLQKILNTEISLKYANKAVIGGLPKLLAFWEPNARRDGLEASFIDGVAIRLRGYPDLPEDKRPLAIAELMDMVKAANVASLPKRPEPKREAPPAPRPEAPKPEVRRDMPPRWGAPSQAPSPKPRPEPPRQGQPKSRPEHGTPPPARPPQPPSAQPRAESPQPASPEAPAPERAVPGEPALTPALEASRAEPKPSAPKPQPKPQAATQTHAQPHERKRIESSSFQMEPLDPRPRRHTGPKPLKAQDPINPSAGLDAPLTVLRGIGPETAKDFARIGVESLRDLLVYFPRRYDNYSRLKTINRLEYGEECTLIATVQDSRQQKYRANRTMLKVVLSDGTGAIEVTEFNPWRAKLLTPGRQIVVSGKVSQYLGHLTIIPREWEQLDHELLNTGRIVPVYGLTEGLYQRSVRNLTAQVVNFWARKQPDPLPSDLILRNELMVYGEALAQIHFPDGEAQLEAARHRLAFDELLCLQIGVLRQRRQWQAEPGQPLTVGDDWLQSFVDSLPYQLTGTQGRALADIRQDLSRAVPMSRLLQGDVGSGKTAVAAIAMAITVRAGAQAALMVPTSILAEQHFKTITQLLGPGAWGLGASPQPPGPSPIRLLQGSTPAGEKEEIYAGLRSGEVKAVIGTHALIESPVEFANLGLVVIDEQHRFGVSQRAALRGKGTNPHLLVMTATPIPRTLALTVYGDLDLSILDEMPPGRQPITTYTLHANERERGYQFIRREVQKGRQAFLIFPLVEESEKIEAKAAVEEHTRLQKEIFPQFKLGLLHGRMRPDEKEEVMSSFRAGAHDLLVSTSVVEVGVDVPNATVILIDGANRFGLAQLHQFRGRVGRGEHASYCLLVSDSPNPAPDERLKAMEATQDGFVLAEKDLDMRGPGDFLGTRQSGFADLRTAKLSDVKTIEKARREAQWLFERDPDLRLPEHQALAQMVNRFWTPGAGDVS